MVLRNSNTYWGNILGNINNQIDLQTEFAGKSANNHTHDDRYSQIGHHHVVADIDGLQADLDAKASITYVESVVGGSPTATVADRPTLANTNPSISVVYLLESGREGIFQWSSANNATLVTADTQQGVYVAPASDTTGASGAWVRHPNTRLNVKWFGAKGDNTTNDSAAFLGALSFALNTRQAVFTYGYGTTPIYVPPGRYFLNTSTLDIYGAIHLYGDLAGSGGSAAVLRWADGTTGIRTQSDGTSGASGSGGSFITSNGTMIERLGLQGGYAGTVSESHGIHLRAPAVIRDVTIYNFPGDGIYANCQIGGGGALEGQANLSRIENAWLEQNRNGMYLAGADSNAITIENCSAMDNRSFGFNDSSFLGNYYHGCHTRTNAGGAYRCDPTQLNAACTLDDCYSESDQPTSTVAPKTLIKGGFHAAGITGGGAIGAVNNLLNLSNALIGSTGTTGTGTANVHYLSLGDTYSTTAGQNLKLRLYDDANGPGWSYGFGVSASELDYVAAPGANHAFWQSTSLVARIAFSNGATTISHDGTVGGSLILQNTGGTYGTARLTLLNENGNNGAIFETTDATAQLVDFQFKTTAANTHSLRYERRTSAFTGGIGSTIYEFQFGTPAAAGTTIGDAGVSTTGALKSSGTAGIGYITGAGGTVTQATNKSTGVTINKTCGRITTSNAALANSTVVTFTVTNSTVANTDCVNITLQSGNATAGTYQVWPEAVAAGSFKVNVRNISAGSLSEALVLNFAVVKGVTS